MKVFIGEYPENPADKRMVQVRIDDYDTWNADHTLALIIHPLLVRLRNAPLGFPSEVGSIEAWEIILDKIIWSFETILNDNHDDVFFPLTKGDNKAKFQTHWERIQEGFTLFGDYFMALVRKKKYEAHQQQILMKQEALRQEEAEKVRVHEGRLKEGFSLFGKYFTALWT